MKKGISAAAGACGLSWPIFAKFCKVIVVPDQPDLRFALYRSHKAIARAPLTGELRRLHHGRVHLTAERSLCRTKRAHHVGESHIAKHHHVDIAMPRCVAPTP